MSYKKSLEYPEFDYETIRHKLCSAQTFQRVLKEASDVNSEFHTLRTIIKAADTVGVLHFVQYPADGALTNKPIFGRILIPRDYPENPPIVHIFTKTERWNVDIYNGYCYRLDDMHSSACFDILRSEDDGGTWKPEFTLSALLASLLQSIVSINVPQEYGSDIKEFVSMEKLESIYKNVSTTYNKYSQYIPEEARVESCVINKVSPVPIETNKLEFIQNSFSAMTEMVLESNPFKLSDIKDSLSIGIDCSNLYKNMSTVFSIVLTTNPDDLTGKKNETVLFRNGVTGTAAKKVPYRQTL